MCLSHLLSLLLCLKQQTTVLSLVICISLPTPRSSNDKQNGLFLSTNKILTVEEQALGSSVLPEWPYERPLGCFMTQSSLLNHLPCDPDWGEKDAEFQRRVPGELSEMTKLVY